QTYQFPPEEILSHSFYVKHPEEFFRFYKEKMLYLDAKPNIGHEILAKLEEMGKLKAVITQNIDGLHQKAGSKHVYELHGSVRRNYCTRCGKFYSANQLLEQLEEREIPSCDCGGRMKPDVVLYEESLNQKTMEDAMREIQKADMLIIGGTSLAVYPAAGLIQYYRGDKLVLINKTATPLDNKAQLCIQDSFGKVISEAVKGIKA
ncbi:MAG: NAD-dependent protein deacylase, partial [Firmicutes bacterium]|nr:NAD-dependent protein deacylase [Candidatus Scybalomonas excrementavium]